MSFLTMLSATASNIDIEVKKLFHYLLNVGTVAAAGSTYADASALTASRNVVTASDGSKGVMLPRANAGTQSVEVTNTVSNQALKVYPNTGDQINALTATSGAFTQAAGSRATYVCDTPGHWYVAAANLTGTATSASQAELDQLASSSAVNATTGKAAILGTDGALTLGGALTAVGTIGIGSAVLSEAEMEMLDGITAGTSLPSKALVTDAAESLAWATTDATASETCTLTITDTRTGAGATGWAAKFDVESNVALGSYANGAYGIIAFGATGKVTGLAAGVCSETVLSAGCTDGTYAGLEVELGLPSGAATGTLTSLLHLSVYGADASAFDTSGYFFNLVGVTKNTGKVLADATTGATARPVQVLRVKTPDGDRYLPLYSTVAIAA